MSYFIRQTPDPQADIERGFSAVGGEVLGADEVAALRELASRYYVEDEDFDAFADAHERQIRFHAELGGYVQARRGLCAHAAFDTLEEAIEAFQSRDIVFLADAGMWGNHYVFAGEIVFENDELVSDDGCVFRPSGEFWQLD